MTTNDNIRKPVRVGDREELKGELKSIGGSQSDHWNNLLANAALKTLWVAHSDDETRDRQYSATVAALVGIGPKDEWGAARIIETAG